jgi:Ketopantoate reductase
MRVLIVGAGALGGLVGAFLTRAGEDVTLLETNAARAHLLNTDGLQIVQSGGGESITVPLRVVTSTDGLEPFDLVFIAVKTYQTEDAVKAALPAAHSGTRFLSMQNGVGNTDVMARLVGPGRVLCGITYHSVQHVGPGRLQFRAGIKPIQIGPCDGIVTPAIDAIGETFRRAGLDTAVVADIDHSVAKVAAQRGDQPGFRHHRPHLPRDPWRRRPAGIHSRPVRGNCRRDAGARRSHRR